MEAVVLVIHMDLIRVIADMDHLMETKLTELLTMMSQSSDEKSITKKKIVTVPQLDLLLEPVILVMLQDGTKVTLSTVTAVDAEEDSVEDIGADLDAADGN